LLTGSDVQWQFVHGLYEFAIYGGRVDNTFDLRVLVSYLKQFFDGSVLSNQSRNKRLGALRLPSSTNHRVCISAS
jgi:dynein heavy chain 2